MTTRTSLRVSAILLATSYLVSCFPQLPDETLVDNLRVLAIQADPATANLLAFPAPLVTVTALVVDPDDPELSDATHTWSLELPEGVDPESLEGLQNLLPAEPHGASLTIDFSVGFARDDEDVLPELVEGILPLRYEVVTPRDNRSAVKLVRFLLPDLVGDDDDSADFPWGDDDDSADFPWGDDDDSASTARSDDDDSAGDDDDSAGDDDDSAGDDDDSAGDDDDSAGDDDDSAGDDDDFTGDDDDFTGDDDDFTGDDDDFTGDDDDSFPWGDDDDGFPWGDDDDSAFPEDPWGALPEFNQNPEIISISIGEQSFPAEGTQLPGINTALLIGDVPEAGVTLRVEVADDTDLEELNAALFRTAGCPNLKPEEPEGRFGPGGPGAGGPGSANDDPCDIEESGGFSFGGEDDEEQDFSIREFAWRPLPGESSAGARLFVVLRDESGGQTWQELRPE